VRRVATPEISIAHRITVDFNALTQIAECNQLRTGNVCSRPDGSLTHW
jgi:hypothetical protein